MREDAILGVHKNSSECAPIHSDVVLDLLATLRSDHYTPTGWARFSARSWHIARRSAKTHPSLTLSWRRVSVGLTFAEVVALAAEARLGGASGRVAARRAAPGAALCLAYTLADAYVHLGMNQATHEAPLYDTLGLPNILTLSRSVVAGLLAGHLAGRASASDVVLSLALATASLTDIADGQIARRMGRSTRLGAYLDAEADFALAIVMTLALLKRRTLPRWLATAMFARWLIPFIYALANYFGKANRVSIGSTRVGKVAGAAQMGTLGIALLPEHVRKRAPGLRDALHTILAALLVAAPLAQLAQAQRMPLGPDARLADRMRNEEAQRHGR